MKIKNLLDLSTILKILAFRQDLGQESRRSIIFLPSCLNFLWTRQKVPSEALHDLGYLRTDYVKIGKIVNHPSKILS